MHIKASFVNLRSSSSLESVLTGLRHVARAAGRRRTVLPSASGSDDPEDTNGPPGGSPGSGLGPLPEEGLSAEKLYADLERLTAGAALVARSGWLGHMDPPPTWASVLGSASGALLNNNLLMPEMSPSFTPLEGQVARAFATEMGLGPESSGTFTAGGSLANLLALAVARNERLPPAAAQGIDRGAELSRLTIVVSDDAHVSLARAAMLLGLDPVRGVLRVAPDANGRLDPADVERAIGEAEAAGQRPFALVATAGTTVLGAVDPLAALAELAASRELWFHVDAAYGGALVFSRRRRSLLDGIAAADSVTVNPQKWLCVAKVCALALFADGERWRRAMAGELPYAMPEETTSASGAAQVEGTRQADVVKLWLSMRQMGRRGIEELVEHGFRLTRRFEAEVRSRPYLRLAAEPRTNIVVFGWSRADGTSAEGPTVALQRRLLEKADVFLSLPRHRGRRWLRAVLLNPFADDATIDRLFDAIDAFADESDAR